MTRIRDRYGIAIFRRFFEAIVERCHQAGLVWGKELYADGTFVDANADRDKMLPRFAVEAHLQQLFGDAYAAAVGADRDSPVIGTTEPVGADRTEQSLTPARELGVDLPQNAAPSLSLRTRPGTTGTRATVNWTAASNLVAIRVCPTCGSV